MVDFNTLLDGVDIAQVAGLSLRGNSNGERYGACPKCGGVDRLHVKWHAGRTWFFCRKCHPERGDFIDFLVWRDGLDKREAVREAERILNRTATSAAPDATTPTTYATTGGEVELPPEENWQATILRVIETCEAALWADNAHAAKAREWLGKRGLNDDTLRAFHVGYQPDTKGATIAGHYIPQGFTLPSIVGASVWQVRIRRTPKALKDRPELSKYTGTQGNKTGLFNAASLRGAKVAIVTGGEFDAMLAAQTLAAQGINGVGVVTFGSETKSPSLRWLMALARVDRVLVAYDNDGEGERGADRWKAALGERVQRVSVPSGKDITEFWQNGGDLAAWLAVIIGAANDQPKQDMPQIANKWRPPADVVERVALEVKLRAEVERGEPEDEHGRETWARLYARWMVLQGYEAADTGERWLELAQ